MTITPSATPVAFVQVIDRARALAFYQDVLGLTLKSS
jgi:predicted enzyme related to lactoylglutathione lyase